MTQSGERGDFGKRNKKNVQEMFLYFYVIFFSNE